jgi:hypothetical protein
MLGGRRSAWLRAILVLAFVAACGGGGRDDNSSVPQDPGSRSGGAGASSMPGSAGMHAPKAGTGGAAPASGSGGMSAPSTAPNAVTYHKDIRPLVEAHCLACHVAGGVGPFALDTYDAVKMVEGDMVHVVTSGFMPPWPADSACNPLIEDRSLPQAEKDRFAAWKDGGYLEGDPSQYMKPPPVEQIVPIGDPDIMLAASGSYTPQANADEYRCYYVGSVDKDTYFSGMAIMPGVRAEVRHAQIHRVDAAQVAALQMAEDSDPAPGYSCQDALPQEQIMFTYRPDSLGVSFPKGDAGFLPAGSGLLLQVHYNTMFLPSGTSPAPDKSAMAFWTLPDGDLPDRIMYRTTVWGSSDLPAGNPDVVTTTNTPMRNLSSFDAIGSTLPDGPAKGDGFGAPAPSATATFVPGEIVGITPHAHQLATRMSASLKPAGGGAAVCLLDVPRWDFDWQLDYMLQTGVPYGPDDILSATCTWDNSAANQPVIDGMQQAPRDVTFGVRSIDEMCQHWVWLRFDRKAYQAAIGK